MALFIFWASWWKEEKLSQLHSCTLNRYWHHVKLASLQAEGIKDGYIDLVQDGQAEDIPEEDLTFINIGLDLMDLLRALAYQGGYSLKEMPQISSCSAMVKMVGDDLYASHVSLRIDKSLVSRAVIWYWQWHQ